MSELIEEMAQSGPSSVLDLAEKVNAEQSRYAIADSRAARGPRGAGTPASSDPRLRGPAVQAAAPAGSSSAPAPSPGRPTTGPVNKATAPAAFAAVLERIARQEGLVSPDHADEILPDSWDPVGAPVSHAGAILLELPEVARGPGVAGDGHSRGPVALWEDRSQPVRRPEVAPPALRRERSQPPAPLPPRQRPDLVLALHGLGLPVETCQAMSLGTAGEVIEAELSRALEMALPDLPPIPREATSVVAVVGARGQVMATARALAAELGTPEDEVALATQRNVWRPHECVIASAEAALEQRRSWRWRGHPSVVAIECPVRPQGPAWASALLRALQPTLCWGVAEAWVKPEDVVAWSNRLGGLDVLALVELDETTTPAAALNTALPVGLVDGQPATPEMWARILCSRLTAG